ncbi:MAG: glycoside hydrolase family 88 protein [Bacteroidales bacterium]|nr:glycoside hydrolase family 88 protein [Bacteroidales bacterium]
MKNQIYNFLILLLIWTGRIPLNGQDKNVIEIQLRKVADYIVNNTTYNFYDEKNGTTFENLKGIEITKNIRVKSPYLDWKYWNGVLNLGFLELGSLLNEPKYAEYPFKQFNFIFPNLKYFEKEWSKYSGHEVFAFYEYFAMSELDHCGAMAASLYEVTKTDPKEEYLDYLAKAADYITNKEKRLDDGTLARHRPRPGTIWLDDLYMSTPFIARYGAFTGNSKYYDFATKQVIQFNKYLYNPLTGLFYHCYYSEDGVNGVAHWSRANGWGMMATVEVLKYLPNEHPQRDSIISLLKRQIEGLARYQSESGLWHQLLDKEDSYLETSSTAMFTYCIAKAVNEGWIHPNYIQVAQMGWKGIATKIYDDGQVEGICMGTGIRSDLNYYYTRPTPLNDIHGLGAVLLAGSELLKYKKP